MIVSVAEDETVDTMIGKLPVKDICLKRWPSGKIFVRYLIDDLLGILAEDMRQNIRDGYDNMVVIDGGEGSGKSNLAYALCSAYDPSFDLDTYTYDTKGFTGLLKKGIGHKTIWMDEGSNIASNREWNTQDNKDFILYLETMRSKGSTFTMCIPTRERLDIYIREHRARYMIHCEGMRFDKTGYKARGYFELQKRAENGKMRHIGYGEYDVMPADVKVEYEKLKAKSQQTIIDKILHKEDEKPGAKYKQKYEDITKRLDAVMLSLYEGGYDRDSLMEMFGIENSKTFANRISKARGRA